MIFSPYCLLFILVQHYSSFYSLLTPVLCTSASFTGLHLNDNVV